MFNCVLLFFNFVQFVFQSKCNLFVFVSMLQVAMAKKDGLILGRKIEKVSNMMTGIGPSH